MPNILPSSLPSGAKFRFGSHTDSPDMWDKRNSRDTPTPHSFPTLPRPSPENDSQPAMSHGSQSELQVDANANLGTSPLEDYIFPTLREYHGPIVAVINQHDTRQIIQLPTSLSRRNIHRNISVMAHRTHGIRNGGEASSWPDFENMKVATRRLQRDIFPRELNLLDKLLVNVAKNLGLDTSEEVRPDEAANDGFLILGQTPPKLPTVGSSGSLDQAFDYEGQQVPRSIADTLTEEPLAIAQRPAHGTQLQHSPQPVQQPSFVQTIRSILHSPVVPTFLPISTLHPPAGGPAPHSTNSEFQQLAEPMQQLSLPQTLFVSIENITQTICSNKECVLE
ncbi:hypothetical protein C8R43DRAFT_1208931 [Mycena crocata]|nr:hypothetical protein C8R43DRAFT_1208931 [Mycena crocata]